MATGLEIAALHTDLLVFARCVNDLATLAVGTPRPVTVDAICQTLAAREAAQDAAAGRPHE